MNHVKLNKSKQTDNYKFLIYNNKRKKYLKIGKDDVMILYWTENKHIANKFSLIKAQEIQAFYLYYNEMVIIIPA